MLPRMIHRAGTELVNYYLLEEGGRVTIVDAGLPGYRSDLDDELRAIGRTISDVEALVLTHAHIDHIGFAAQLHDERGIPVHVPEAEAPQATTGKAPSTEGSLPSALVRHSAARRLLAHIVKNGGARPPKIAKVETFSGSAELDLPGRPRPVPTPGHSPGHVAFHIAAEGAVLTGDAIMGFCPISGAPGPVLPPTVFNNSNEGVRASLSALETLDAQTVHFGHGDAWTDGIASAVAAARERGTAA